MAELKLQIDAIQDVALKSGKTLPEFIQKFQAHSDMDISLQGNVMKEMTSRFMDLTTAYGSMMDASPLFKPFVFAQHLQWSVAKGAFQDFSLGVPFTLEGGIYALLGMIVGYSIYSSLKFLLSKLKTRMICYIKIKE